MLSDKPAEQPQDDREALKARFKELAAAHAVVPHLVTQVSSKPFRHGKTEVLVMHGRTERYIIHDDGDDDTAFLA